MKKEIICPICGGVAIKDNPQTPNGGELYIAEECIGCNGMLRCQHKLDTLVHVTEIICSISWKEKENEKLEVYQKVK